MKLDARKLVEQAKTDPHTFGALYDRYFDRIYAYASRHTGDPHLAQDVTAATFEKALQNIRCFRWRGITFAAWLHRIAHDEIANIVGCSTDQYVSHRHKEYNIK